ncbi:response regulator [Silvibacterium acidisoli]|uniref:response regulator n=1 Tax=Acidobacteriaceae bacterium ZG23-2 TaxID=2883246 RepID=UPI00406C4A00
MRKVLCVDDDPGVIQLKRSILEKAGYEVTACNSAEEAIRELDRVVYDAVVTDWRLGPDSGRAVVEAAKGKTRAVVVVSGYVAEAFQAAEPMADIYLEKPAHPGELVQILKILLESGEKSQKDFPVQETA